MSLPFAPGDFVIAARDGEAGLLFWNNENGFAGLDQATIFSEAETRELTVPFADNRPHWLALPSRRQEVPREPLDIVMPSRARFKLLDLAHALMSEYLADECPEDEHWEDFDAEIDGLRSEIADVLEHESGYLASLPAKPHRLIADIEFLSEHEHFATETYEVEAFDWTDAKQAAFRLADESPYTNDRIPDLRRRAVDRTDYGASAPG